MSIVVPILALLGAQLAGEALSRAFGLPISGPVLGFLIMAAVLLIRRRPLPEPLQRTSQGLLRLLALLFVPAGVGVIAEADVARGHVVALAAAVVGSTLITLLVAAGVFRIVARLTEARR